MGNRCLALAAMALTAAFANADWNVYANGYVYTNNLAGGSAKVDHQSGHLATASVDLFTDEAYDDHAGHTGYAYSRLKESADPGHIHVFGDAYATNDLYPGYNGGIAGFQYSDSFPGYAGGWSDTLTPTSTTLAVGSPVQIQMHVVLGGTLSGTGLAVGSAQPYLRSYLGGGGSLLALTAGTHVVTEDLVATGYVGATMAIASGMDLRASTTAIAGSSPARVTVDAWNTGYATIRTLTPGTSFATDSGYNYQAVPEPAPIAAVGLGALGLLRRRRR